MSLKPQKQQIGFTDLSMEGILKPFQDHPLLQIKRRFPFERFDPILNQLYSNTGRPGFDPGKMLRLLLLGKLQNLSDKRLEQDVALHLLYREFCGWSLEELTPDHSTLSRFRDRITPVWDKIWSEFQTWLQEEGLVDQDLVIVDATDIRAQGRYRKPPEDPSGCSTPEDKYEQQTDPDARHGYKRVDKPIYGYKAHIATDAKTGMILTLLTTGANAHDGKTLPQVVPKLPFDPRALTADTIYHDWENKRYLEAAGIEDCTIPKQRHGGIQTLAQRMRKRIERINSLLKVVCGLSRTRFFGRLNVDFDLQLGALAVNLVNLRGLIQTA